MRIGVIGYGARVTTMVEDILRWEPESHILINDPREDEIKKNNNNFSFYDTPEELIEKGKPDGILIGTRCSLHAKIATKILPYNIPFILEKPVATTLEELTKLKEAYENYRSPVLVSFPLRFADITRKVKNIIDSNLLGEIQHVQAVNNVPYGGVYYQSWYRDEKETGGLFLQKATHDLDYINYILGIKPIVISAMESKQIYNGNKPEALLWENSDEKWTSPESPYVKAVYGEEAEGSYDPFSKDTGNHDSASVLIKYETGMHVVYSQNFYSRKNAKKRGAILIGYKGTLEFDYYTQTINIHMHFENRDENIKFNNPEWMAHYGGDNALALNFIGMIKNKEEPRASLNDGILSALMCLKAKRSAEEGVFLDVRF